MSKKYYWLKLKNSFFDKQEIKLLEAQENGPQYVLFYLKLLLKSVESEGALRLNAEIAYDDKMLAVITNTNIDIVRSALKAFQSLGLAEYKPDKTLYMHETRGMIASETDEAVRKREYRDKQKNKQIGTMSGKCPTEIDIEIEKEIDIEKEKDILIPPLPPLKVGVECNNKNNFSFPTDNSFFNTFWNQYPKKAKLKQSYDYFLKLDVSKELLNTILEALSEQSTSEQWNRELGRFIPDAVKWLKNQSWNDNLATFKQIEISDEVSQALDAVFQRL
jgi:predicted phage replisome organizer